MITHLMNVTFVDAPNSDSIIKIIGLNQEKLMINNTVVETHKNNSVYSWTRICESGQKEEGSIRIISHGNASIAKGAILLNNEEYQFSAIGLVDYRMTIDQKEDWYDLEMGFEEDEKGNLHSVSVLSVFGDETETNTIQKFSNIILSLKPGALIPTSDPKDIPLHEPDRLVALIEIDPSYCSFGGSKYVSAELTFSLDYQKFSGVLYEYDLDGEGYRGKEHKLEGECRASSDRILFMNKVDQFNIDNIGSNETQKNKISLNRQLLQHTTELSIEELYTLPAPDFEALHQQSFSRLKALMLYSIDDDTRKWFGEKKPEVGHGLKQADVDLAKNEDIKDFLVNDFSIGYLTEAFSKSDEKVIQDKFEDINDYGDKLAYFWSGTGDTSFSKSRGYNLATSRIMDNTFIDSVPGFNRYLESDPEKWAKELYEHCIYKTTLNGLALQNTLDGQKRLNQLSTMLHALDPVARLNVDGSPPVSYATALHEQVINIRLNHIITNFAPGDKEDFVAFLTEYFKQYFDELLSDDSWQGEANAIARKDLHALMDEYSVDSVNDLVNHLSDIIVQSVDVLIKFKNLPLPARLHEFSERYPKISSIFGGFMTMAVYGFGIFTSVSAFMDWKDLKPEEKVLVITETTALTASIFSDVAGYTATKMITRAGASATELMDAGVAITTEVELTRATGMCNTLGVQLNVELQGIGAPALAGGGAAAGQDIARLGSLERSALKWKKFAKVSEGFAKGFTIIALGAACVATGFQIANDFATDQPVAVKVFDILETVSLGVAFLAEAGAGIAALIGTEVLSFLPVVGVVAAIAGVVIAIVSLFIHRKAPPSPVEIFIDDRCKPFVDHLSSPDAEWIKDQAVASDHLNDKSAFKTHEFNQFLA